MIIKSQLTKTTSKPEKKGKYTALGKEFKSVLEAARCFGVEALVIRIIWQRLIDEKGKGNLFEQAVREAVAASRVSNKKPLMI
jgi:hypothetical protein